MPAFVVSLGYASQVDGGFAPQLSLTFVGVGEKAGLDQFLCLSSISLAVSASMFASGEDSRGLRDDEGRGATPVT